MNRVIRNAAVALLSLATVATAVTSAEAGRRERNFVGGVVAGIAGAAIVSGIARAHQPYYAPGYYQQPTYYAPVYAEPRVVYVEPRRVARRAARRANNAHLDWCFARYRSYDAGSNTYQPYNGPRRQCVSPYL